MYARILVKEFKNQELLKYCIEALRKYDNIL